MYPHGETQRASAGGATGACSTQGDRSSLYKNENKYNTYQAPCNECNEFFEPRDMLDSLREQHV